MSESATSFGDFDRDGWVRIPGAASAEAIGRMRARVWDVLGRELGARATEPETWRSGRADGLKELPKEGVFDVFETDGVRGFLDRRLEDPDGWNLAYRGGRVLFTFPRPGPWQLPGASWHIDINPTARPSRIDGVTLFALLDDLEPEGGGTLLVEGSHRLVIDEVESGRRSPEKARSAALRKSFARQEPWFGELIRGKGTNRRARFMEQTERLRGVDCRVVELTGRAGDVFVVHPHVFHTTAPNVCARPRLMLVEFARRGRPIGRA